MQIKELHLLIIFLYLVTLGWGCQSDPSAQGKLYEVNVNGRLLYHLDQPDQRYQLPDYLQEISGLTYYRDNLLACVQDEDGDIFIFNPESGDIESEFDFGKSGDYEGLEYVNGNFWVLRSDGNLYKWRPGQEKAEKFETPFKEENNLEGLGYDSASNCLLLACKDKALIGGKKYKGRAIYQFNLDNEKLRPDPFILLDHDSVENQLENTGLFSKRHIPFRPSGVAVHPINKDIFLLHSVGKLLIILGQTGEIKSLYPINPLLIEQPEGICFDPQGNLYIASESESEFGYLFLFKKRN